MESRGKNVRRLNSVKSQSLPPLSPGISDIEDPGIAHQTTSNLLPNSSAYPKYLREGNNKHNVGANTLRDLYRSEILPVPFPLIGGGIPRQEEYF